MKITADTNILVRAITCDHTEQSAQAQAELGNAASVAVPLSALCELVWVLARGYRIAAPDIANAIRRLINASNVVTNRPAVTAGLRLMDAGGDFADGVVAHEGQWLGGETFVSFDRQAVELLSQQGVSARQPATPR